MSFLNRFISKGVLEDYTKIPIATGADLYISGHIAVLRMVAVSTSDLSIDSQYRPTENMLALGRHKTTNNKYYPCVLVLDINTGKVNGQYFTESESNTISSGVVHGELVWIIP